MSQTIALLKQIENLDSNELAEALEFNGYAECTEAIRKKNIDGQEFLKLTELKISLWRLPAVHARRLWSFIQHVNEDPKQFLMNIKKTTSEVKKSNSASNSKPFITEKPTNIPNKFQKSTRLMEKEDVLQTENTKMNSSTLTKTQSKEIKNKLELVFKKDTTDVPNSSFIHSQRQPSLPPRPDHLRLINTENPRQNQIEEEESDFNNGYLSPITKRKEFVIPKEEEERQCSVNISRSNSTSSTNNFFLNKLRKNYEHLEVRPQVVENKYEEQSTRTPQQTAQRRPLPPIPKLEGHIRTGIPNVNSPTVEEELPDYTPVLEEEESCTDHKSKISTLTKTESFNRILPKIPSQRSNEFSSLKQSISNEDNEELPEYTHVIEEEEEEIKTTAHTSKSYNQHRPLPPVPVPFPPITIGERPSKPILTTEDQDSFKFSTIKSQPSVSLQQPVKLKPRAELPKSSNNLPKPPVNLPMPPVEVIPSDFLSITQNRDDTQIRQRSSPIPPNGPQIQDMPAEIEDSFYTEIDLATLSCYRETDRKGARRLLSGLDDGAFLIRPSRQPEYNCTLSIITVMKMYNLGIQKKPDGSIAFGAVGDDFQQPKVYSIGELIGFYSKTPLCLSGEYIILKDILPRSRR